MPARGGDAPRARRGQRRGRDARRTGHHAAVGAAGTARRLPPPAARAARRARSAARRAANTADRPLRRRPHRRDRRGVHLVRQRIAAAVRRRKPSGHRLRLRRDGGTVRLDAARARRRAARDQPAHPGTHVRRAAPARIPARAGARRLSVHVRRGRVPAGGGGGRTARLPVGGTRPDSRRADDPPTAARAGRGRRTPRAGIRAAGRVGRGHLGGGGSGGAAARRHRRRRRPLRFHARRRLAGRDPLRMGTERPVHRPCWRRHAPALSGSDIFRIA